MNAHEDPEPTCPYCGRAFARADYRDLHLGLEHESQLTEAEQAAVEMAREREAEALRLFRYKALGVVVVAYFLFLMAFAVSL
ncbi:C2H2-type zinc finger protein [Halosegnis sp.]|uniref:DUF7410 domain-containing protein n=1 Tax=Halosegnis sp. TaxID=2864959 RepID=UPI0035D42802